MRYSVTTFTDVDPDKFQGIGYVRNLESKGSRKNELFYKTLRFWVEQITNVGNGSEANF